MIARLSLHGDDREGTVIRRRLPDRTVMVAASDPIGQTFPLSFYICREIEALAYVVDGTEWSLGRSVGSFAESLRVVCGETTEAWGYIGFTEFKYADCLTRRKPHAAKP